MFKQSILGIAAIGLLASASSHAALVIDTFDDQPQTYTVSATGPGTETTSGTALFADSFNGNDDMIGTHRMFSGTTVNAGTTAGGDLDINTTSNFGGDTFLSISNQDNVQGSVSVMYDSNGAGLGGLDFASNGTALIMDVLSIDTGVTVEVIISDTGANSSTSGAVAFSGAGTFFVSFASFVGSADFSLVDSVELKFEGTPSWDGSFDYIRTDDPPVASVPAPASVLLLGLGLIGMGYKARKRA